MYFKGCKEKSMNFYYVPPRSTKKKKNPQKQKTPKTKTPQILTIINYLPLSLKIMIKNK